MNVRFIVTKFCIVTPQRAGKGVRLVGSDGATANESACLLQFMPICPGAHRKEMENYQIFFIILYDLKFYFIVYYISTLYNNNFRTRLYSDCTLYNYIIIYLIS